MGVDSEVGLLKRQNRRLKVALSIVTTLLLIAMGMVGMAGLRGRALAEQARDEAERARGEAVRALQIAEDAREQTESQNDVEP